MDVSINCGINRARWRNCVDPFLDTSLQALSSTLDLPPEGVPSHRHLTRAVIFSGKRAIHKCVARAL